MENKGIAIFENHAIRRVWHEEEWWFSVVDIVEVLTESGRPRKYWNDLKIKLISEECSEVSEKIGQLKLVSPYGKKPGKPVQSSENFLGLKKQNKLNKKTH